MRKALPLKRYGAKQSTDMQSTDTLSCSKKKAQIRFLVRKKKREKKTKLKKKTTKNHLLRTTKTNKTFIFIKKPRVKMTGFEPATPCSQNRRATSCATSWNFVCLKYTITYKFMQVFIDFFIYKNSIL